MKCIECPSPNCDDREGHAIDMLVLHYTGMKNVDDARDKLCNANNERKVSAHYLVDEDGAVYRLVPEGKRAWHAGVSYWRGQTNINQRSIGIEIVNPGHEFGYRPFPKAQMVAVAELCKEIIARHNIPARNVVGHSDIAPERKDDPGELFDWKWLAEQGIGLFPSLRGGEADVAIQFSDSGLLRSARNDELQEYGYDTTNLPKTITAFQRHWRPKSLTGKWDRECALILQALLDSNH